MIVSESYTPVDYDFDVYHQMLSALPYMVAKARTAAENDSASYRGFHVGAAAFAINRANRSTGIFNGGNIKTKKTHEKVCAEKRSVKQAEKHGFEFIPGIVVVATTDKELISEVNQHNIVTPTLPPCAECQDPNGSVAGSPLVDSRHTLILTTGIKRDIYQVHSLGEIQAGFATGDGSSLQEARPYFSWESSLQMYDFLRSQEQRIPLEGRRHDAQLAKLALLTQMF